MSDDPIYHLLCINCGRAIVADSIAKRQRIPRRSHCPVCGERRGNTWRPIEGPAKALEVAVGHYETVESRLSNHGLTIIEDEDLEHLEESRDVLPIEIEVPCHNCGADPGEPCFETDSEWRLEYVAGSFHDERRELFDNISEESGQ